MRLAMETPPLREFRLSPSLSPFRHLAAIGILAIASSPAAAQWQETTFNPASGVYPVDCATTPNNNRAAVRYAGPTSSTTILSVWDLVPTAPAQLATFGGAGLKPGNLTTVAPLNFRAYQPSDRVELTNSIGMSIGSGDSTGGALFDDETYVEFFDMAATPPAFLTQYVFTSTSPVPQYYDDHAGLANDLAISRDGEWGVVNSDNHIHVFYLGQFPSQITWTSFNIGDIDYRRTPPLLNWNQPCSPNLAVDSVALTNERAVVTTARLSSTFGTYTTWVYIVDLTGTSPAISLQQEITPPHGWNPQVDDYDRPHDIAITSARLQDRFAVVTTTHGVAAFDLSSDTMRGTYFNADDWRKYQKQVDSVEVTDEDVLTIADNTPVGGTTHWQVRRFKLSPAVGMTLYASDGPAPTADESHAHDLAIDLGFDKAIVRADIENVCYTGLDTTTPTYVVVPSSSNSWAYQQYGSQLVYNIFSSDAAVISPETNGQIWAATIGGYVDPFTGLWNGLVDLIDLNAPTVPVPPLSIPPNSPLFGGCVPVDLAVSANHTEIVVRSADPYPETSPATGPDLVRILLTAVPQPAITVSYGGSGTVMGLDSLAAPQLGFIAVAKRILSISEQEGTLPGTGDDYTHVNR